jgi:YcxB-like protein
MTLPARSGIRHQFLFRWSFAEHMRAQRAMMRYMRGGWQFKVLPVVIAVLLLLLVLSVALFGTRADRSWIEIWSPILPYALILILILVMVRWGTPWLAARRIQRNDPSVKGEFQHVVADSGVAVQTVAVTMELSWEHLQQVVETPEFFLFYYTSQSAYFTPKRAIPSADLPSLRDTIRAHMGTRARLDEVRAPAA